MTSLERSRHIVRLVVHGCLVVLVSVLASLAEASAASDAVGSKNTPVVTVDLCGLWSFAYTPGHTGTVPGDTAFAASMPVPGCWDDHLSRSQAEEFWKDARFNPEYRPIKYPMDASAPDGSLPYLLGSGWYRKELKVPDQWRDRQVTLRVGRVVMEGWVYMNGREVHHHLGHSTRWDVCLTPHLKFGETNEITIAVANTRTDRIGAVIRGWKGRSSGIFGPVSVKVAGRARIADVFVYHQDGKLQWRVELEGETPGNSQSKWKIRDPRTGKSLGEGSQPVDGNKLRWTTGTLGLPPWSDRRPSLVQMEIELRSDETCLDVHRQPFGLRRLTRDGIGLQLNGKEIYLRGVCESAYYPETCTPPLQLDWYRRHIRRLKEIGFNWLRFHTWVPTEPYMQAADELGMLIQVEPPRGYEIGEWRDIMRACRKHPSVVIYCCGNEEQLANQKIEFLRQCAAELREAVPDALFNPQEAMRGVEYRFTDEDKPDLVHAPMTYNPVKLARLKEFSDVFGQYTWGQLSYATLGGNHLAIDDRLVVYERPCLTHELGIIGCYLDLNLQQRYASSRIGPDLYSKAREALDRAGLLDRVGLYYRNSAAWQRLIRKDVVEMARKCHLIRGYDMLGANDIHRHRTGYGCGLLNEFDELKAGESAADVLRYNGESVLLISRQRERNLLAGQPLARELLVSWFATDALRDGTLRWSLKAADGSILGNGREIVEPVEPGAVKKIATIKLATPESNEPTKATLSVELSGEACRLDNQWDYWIFPSASAGGKSDVRVVSSLDADSLSKLIHGARVVLIGHKPFPARATSFQIGTAGRPQRNLATIIADHPLTDGFPHDGYCDWQFYRMLHGGTAVSFDDMEESFDPILEVVSSYKQIRKQAALFEWRVGSGRLLVCSLKLPPTDPAAAYFRRILLDYAASDRFQPRTKVEARQLAKMLNRDLPALEQQQETDQGFDKHGQLPKDTGTRK